MKRLLVAMALALACTNLAACGSSEPEAEASDRVLKVGLGRSANSLTVYIAAKKFAADHDLKIELVNLDSGAAAIPLLLNGGLDMSLGDSLATLTASANGVPLSVVGVAATGPETPEQDNSAIFVKDDSVTVKDLEGEKVAVSALGGAPELVARAGIDASGGDSSKVDFVEIGIETRDSAIEKGQIKGALLTEPSMTAALQAGTLHELVRPMALAFQKLPVTLWITSQKFAKEQPELVDDFLAAVQDAAVEANEDPAAAKKLGAPLFDMEPGVLDDMRLPVFAEDVNDMSTLPDLVDLVNKYDLFDKQPDLETLVVDGNAS